MQNIKINVELDRHGTFWVRKSGQHHPFRTYAEARGYAEHLASTTNGGAEIIDRVPPDWSKDAPLS
ncbi:hypothetical protein NOJ05_14125 [Neorhizobium galegae]|uniref:hypothetical protein n=1 Tax=Neorhizobium galegae TaxID=399 RepID=UPI00062147CC|nr:hypothetical protein [Neorhizobium galegae]MCQ1778340.1 hypothetical protein [Neorhizobium galegae]MCQ1796685.1 hypothetical protein [Neorhizobium galegae]CDZ29192.1 Hypothetical protein NGAL_HAMBI490_40540 [Neorhizobium galegae bv. officinalis]